MSSISASDESQHEYIVAIGKGAMEDLIGHHDNQDGWTLSKFSDSDVKVYTKKSEDESCPEDMVKAVATLENCCSAQVLALAMPWFPYRTQWDDLLVEGRTVVDVSPSCKLIHHVTKKKMPLSARDSVDVVNVHSRGETIFMSSRSIPSELVPEVKDTVRTVTHLGGYVFRPVGDSVEFEMYFHADLKIGGISLMKSIVESVKPKFMTDLLNSLRKSVRKIAVTSSDLEATKIYTDLQIEV